MLNCKSMLRYDVVRHTKKKFLLSEGSVGDFCSQLVDTIRSESNCFALRGMSINEGAITHNDDGTLSVEVDFDWRNDEKWVVNSNKFTQRYDSICDARTHKDFCTEVARLNSRLSIIPEDSSEDSCLLSFAPEAVKDEFTGVLLEESFCGSDFVFSTDYNVALIGLEEQLIDFSVYNTISTDHCPPDERVSYSINHGVGEFARMDIAVQFDIDYAKFGADFSAFATQFNMFMSCIKDIGISFSVISCENGKLRVSVNVFEYLTTAEVANIEGMSEQYSFIESSVKYIDDTLLTGYGFGTASISESDFRYTVSVHEAGVLNT